MIIFLALLFHADEPVLKYEAITNLYAITSPGSNEVAYLEKGQFYDLDPLYDLSRGNTYIPLPTYTPRFSKRVTPYLGSTYLKVNLNGKSEIVILMKLIRTNR